MTPPVRENCALSDSDSSSDWDEEYDDRDALARCRQALGLSINYVRTWKPRDAFREFFQNWKDAITESFELGPRAFRFDITDNGGVYVAEARHADTGDLLGFIRYKEKGGILELTNFKARLSRTTLDLGVTSKGEKDYLAGTHGEGFKIAALVMVRTGYQARIEASSYYWRFNFAGRSGSHLYCNLSPISEAKLQKQRRAHALKAEKPRELQNHIWEDVSIKVGRVHGPNWGDKITRHEFNQWMKVTIDLDRTTEIIKTSHGSLILDERFSNKVFLKGLLLEGQSGGRKFKYGYDMRHGTVGRDRKALENSSEEFETLASIWGEAMARQEKDCLSKYVSMLFEQPKWADVGQAEKQMSSTTVKAIWEHLQARVSGLKTFYHDDRHGDTDAELIRRSLKKEPAQLPACIWEPLRRFRHVRTPQEERYHLLHNAPVAAEKSTPYASMVKRALRASLYLDTRTKDLELVFKDGTAAELDLLLDGTQLMFNEKWLDFHTSHDNLGCWLSRLSTTAGFNSDTFSCDHVITELYDMVLMEVNKLRGEQGHGAVEADGLLRLRLAENLRQMPRVIRTAPGRNPGEIDVTWMDFEGDLAASLHGLAVKYRVTLHRERTCASKRFDLVTSNGVSDDEETSFPEGALSTAVCGCPEQLVLQKDSKTTFQSLEPEEQYFPMISRTHAQAFYGVQLSPSGIRPKAPGMSGDASTRISISSRLGPSRQENQGASDDIYNASSPDESGDHRGRRSLLSSTIEAVPMRSGGACSPPHRLNSNETRREPLRTTRQLERQLEEAKTNINTRDRQVRDMQAIITTLQSQVEAGLAIQAEAEVQIANLNSEKQVLEGKLHSISELEKDKKDLHVQLMLKIKECQEAQAVPGPSQQELIDRSTREEQLKREMVGLETALRKKDPLNYGIFVAGVQYRYDFVCKKLELLKRISKSHQTKDEEKGKQLEKQEQLLQAKVTDLDTLRTAHYASDLELRDANAKVKGLEDTLEDAQAKIKELEDALEDAQQDLAQTHRMASKYAEKLSGPGSAVKRQRMKEEEGSPVSPSWRGQKRARDGSRVIPYPSLANGVILLDE